MTLPSITLTTGQLACCPVCKQQQSDPIEDYMTGSKMGADKGVIDRCEGCGIRFKIICEIPGTFEVKAQETVRR